MTDIYLLLHQPPSTSSKQRQHGPPLPAPSSPAPQRRMTALPRRGRCLPPWGRALRAAACRRVARRCLPRCLHHGTPPHAAGARRGRWSSQATVAVEVKIGMRRIGVSSRSFKMQNREAETTTSSQLSLFEMEKSATLRWLSLWHFIAYLLGCHGARRAGKTVGRVVVIHPYPFIAWGVPACGRSLLGRTGGTARLHINSLFGRRWRRRPRGARLWLARRQPRGARLLLPQRLHQRRWKQDYNMITLNPTTHKVTASSSKGWPKQVALKQSNWNANSPWCLVQAGAWLMSGPPQGPHPQGPEPGWQQRLTAGQLRQGPEAACLPWPADSQLMQDHAPWSAAAPQFIGSGILS